MKNAVIYARYSSDRQNEMSIDGQIDECMRYAKEHDLVVIQTYIDRAQTATTDKRPNFLRMIEDSADGLFETILVYQLDRFARNKNDSGYYKKILADNGVKVVSAKEQISDDSSGVITEGMLEIVADWFSKQLSEKVKRGMNQRAELCKYNGGTIPFGYDVNPDGYFILNPETAPIVQEIFERTSYGEMGVSIMKDLNSRGVKTSTGKSFGSNSLYRLLRNEKYKGIYAYGDVRVIDGIPRIVSDELFEQVQEILKSRRHHGHRPAADDYILTGKLFCGHCKNQMQGTSGTSRSGDTHRYYKCSNSPKNCKKKNVRKGFIESQVIESCQKLLSDDIIDSVVASVIKQNKSDQESPALIRIRKDIQSIKRKMEALVDQIEEGMGSPIVADRLKQRELELDDLRKQLKKEEAKQRVIDPWSVRLFLISLRENEISDMVYRKMLINIFIDRIYLYDDRFHIFLNNSPSGTGHVGKDDAADVEVFFNDAGSFTANAGTPTKEPGHSTWLFC